MRNRRLRYLVAALITSTLVLLVAAAAAQSQRWRRPPHIIQPAERFSLSLEDGWGATFPTFRRGGTTWVLGEQGERYVIVVHNPTPDRVEAVVSVDGRDAISGQAADFRRHRGYIVQPYGTTRIEGFRKSLDDVATFRFTDPSDSYSSRMGTPENVGVIGVAFFRERRRDPPPVAFEERERWRRRPLPAPAKRADGRGAAPRAGAATESDSNLGTEYGEQRFSSVVEVPFERASNHPTRIVTLRYDDAEGLASRGIDVFPRRTARPRPFAPAPFPESRFAPPP